MHLAAVLDRLDTLQRRSTGVGFLFGVNKKFGDDGGGMLAALLAYYGFLSIFPLLLLLVTVVGLITGGNTTAIDRVEHSALAQFPVIGTHLGNNIHSLHDRAGIGLVIGIIGLIWGSQGIVQTGMHAMAQIWYVPVADRPGFAVRILRYLVMLSVVGVFLLVSTALTGVVTVGNRSVPEVFGAAVLTLLANVGIYVLSFRVLTPGSVSWRYLWPGAVLGGTGWTVLQYVGGVLVDHTLRNTSQIYGFFAVVLGLLAWIYLWAQLTMYAAEVNVVLQRRLWPRGLRDPTTEADRRVLASLALQHRVREDERIEVTFDERPPDDAGAQDDDRSRIRSNPPAPSRPEIKEETRKMDGERWAEVDRYISESLVPPDPALDAALEATRSAGMPAINVSPNQGKFLQLVARIQGARRILEVGTLGGYSTIWLARSLPAEGSLISLELDPKHAEVARANIERAGLSDVVTVRIGRAIDSLEELEREGTQPFDLVFIDADKAGNPEYFEWALRLSKPGSVVIVDNVVRNGAVLDADSTDPGVVGTRRLNQLLSTESRVSATEIQTVGSKGYDGFALALVLDG